MLKILIIDDEEATGNLLKVLIERCISLPKEILYCNNPTAALQLLPSFQPQLVMLDIEMPGMNGFDFLNSTPTKDFDVIFTTAYDKYAIKAIRFSALDYLLKPFDVVELQNAINRHIVKRQFSSQLQYEQLVKNLIQNLQQKSSEPYQLTVSVKEGVFRFELKNIICLEGQNNYTKFFFNHRNPLLVAKTIKEYEELLAEHQFIRIHKSFLVNRSHIKGVDKDGLLHSSNGMVLPVSRRKKSEIIQLLGN